VEDFPGTLVLFGVDLAAGETLAQDLLRRIRPRLLVREDARNLLQHVGPVAEYDPQDQATIATQKTMNNMVPSSPFYSSVRS